MTGTIENPLNKLLSPAIIITTITTWLYIVSLRYTSSYLNEFGARLDWFDLSLLRLLSFSGSALYFTVIAVLLAYLSTIDFVKKRFWLWIIVYLLWLLILLPKYILLSGSSSLGWLDGINGSIWISIPWIWNAIDEKYDKNISRYINLVDKGSVEALNKKELKQLLKLFPKIKKIVQPPETTGGLSFIKKYAFYLTLAHMTIVFSARFGMSDGSVAFIKTRSQLMDQDINAAKLIFVSNSEALLAIRKDDGIHSVYVNKNLGDPINIKLLHADYRFQRDQISGNRLLESLTNQVDDSNSIPIESSIDKANKITETDEDAMLDVADHMPKNNNTKSP